MIKYMEDSSRRDIDPRELTLDHAMQARDVELIKDKRVRSAQEIKQDSQDKEILEDLRNGLPIRQAITVFVVGDVNYVVDGFHRTGACLKFLKENPDANLTIPALVIKNRTFKEAFLAAQEANQTHGVGVTSDEVMQSNFRKLIIDGEYGLSISAIESLAVCSHGQAAHMAKGLKACGKALANETIAFTDLATFTEQLQDGLEKQFDLPNSTWDTKGFPKIRRLSDAVSGKRYDGIDMDDDEWEKAQIDSAMSDFRKMIERYGDDFFREALRKQVKASGLGITITKRKSWLGQAGSVEGDEVPNDWGGMVSPALVEDGF